MIFLKNTLTYPMDLQQYFEMSFIFLSVWWLMCFTGLLIISGNYFVFFLLLAVSLWKLKPLALLVGSSDFHMWRSKPFCSLSGLSVTDPFKCFPPWSLNTSTTFMIECILCETTGFHRDPNFGFYKVIRPHLWLVSKYDKIYFPLIKQMNPQQFIKQFFSVF